MYISPNILVNSIVCGENSIKIIIKSYYIRIISLEISNIKERRRLQIFVSIKKNSVQLNFSEDIDRY